MSDRRHSIDVPAPSESMSQGPSQGLSDDVSEGLSEIQQGFVLGALLSAPDGRLARHIEGPSAAPCRRRIAMLATAEEPARDEMVANLKASLFPPDEIARFVAMADPDLLPALCERGAAVLGQSLRGGPPEARARAMAAVGEPFASVIDRWARMDCDAATRTTARIAMGRAARMKVEAATDRLLTIAIVSWLERAANVPGPDLVRLLRRMPVSIREAVFRA